MAQAPDEIFKYLMDEEIRFIQFIPCLDDLDATERSDFALKPESFAFFYKIIYTLWEKELKKGNYLSIQLIDSIINLLAGKGIGQCGMLGNCSVQYIIEADGGVYPCDFYVLDEYKMGNILESTLFELSQTKPVEHFLCSRPEISNFCKTCPFLNICNGGCKRMENVMYVNEAKDYCGYQNFLEACLEDIFQVPKYLQKIQEANR